MQFIHSVPVIMISIFGPVQSEGQGGVRTSEKCHVFAMDHAGTCEVSLSFGVHPEPRAAFGLTFRTPMVTTG